MCNHRCWLLPSTLSNVFTRFLLHEGNNSLQPASFVHVFLMKFHASIDIIVSNLPQLLLYAFSVSTEKTLIWKISFTVSKIYITLVANYICLYFYVESLVTFTANLVFNVKYNFSINQSNSSNKTKFKTP